MNKLYRGFWINFLSGDMLDLELSIQALFNWTEMDKADPGDPWPGVLPLVALMLPRIAGLHLFWVFSCSGQQQQGRPLPSLTSSPKQPLSYQQEEQADGAARFPLANKLEHI